MKAKNKISPLFVSYEMALLLKEKGFNNISWFAYYHTSDLKNFKKSNYLFVDRNNEQLAKDNRISAPTHQQVIDWLRENHKLIVFAHPAFYSDTFNEWTYSAEITRFQYDTSPSEGLSTDYYLTLNRAIEEALKLIK